MIDESGSVVVFFQAEDGIRDLVRSRGLGDVYKRQYESFGGRIEGSGVDPGRLELWWTDERFTATDDPALSLIHI
mgnify:CR=1 FL=1